jgi:hypothetical protein
MLPAGDGGGSTAKRAARFVEEMRGALGVDMPAMAERITGGPAATPAPARAQAEPPRADPPRAEPPAPALPPAASAPILPPPSAHPIVDALSTLVDAAEQVVETKPAAEVTLGSLAERRKRVKKDLAAELGEFEKKMRERRGGNNPRA